MDLKEILDKEGDVFIDSNIIDPRSDLLKRLYGVNYYSELDNSLVELIKYSTNYMNYILGILRQERNKEKLFVIKEVIEEIKNLQRSIIEKQKYLNISVKKLARKDKNKHIKYRKSIRSEKHKISFEEFNRLALALNNVIRVIGSREYRKFSGDYRKKSVYNIIGDLVITVSSYILKKKNPEDFDGVKRVSRLFKPENRKYTDQKLVSIAIYNSLFFPNNQSCVVSRDTDLIMLFRRGLSLIGARDINGNELFRELLVNNPIKLYLPVNSPSNKNKAVDELLDYECCERTDNCNFLDEFRINYLDAETNKKIKNHLEYLFQRFHKYLEQISKKRKSKKKKKILKV